MKCENCNKDVQVTMKYCPYCSYDLTNQVLEYQKKRKEKQDNIIHNYNCYCNCNIC